MRRFFVLILFTAATFVCGAQNAEFGRLTITPYIAPESGFDASASREDIEKAVLAHPDVMRFVGDATVRKIIVVPNKLVNVVAK